MTKSIMVQGTMSGAGKSLLVTALCRILREDGFRVAPFKSQNMALNSYVTKDGLEMGRAQVVQAQAAGIEPDVRMNPILLKPSSDVGSQLIVNGEVRGHYNARDYFAMKRSLVPSIMEAYASLAAEHDVVVIEGAGSPAEINLRDDDIVNMGLAELVDAPVVLVGDIDRGGVFAQLFGTIALLRDEERARIVGTVINKFRGDVEILRPGLAQLEELTGVPVLGVIPYSHADIDDEDSLSERLSQHSERVTTSSPSGQQTPDDAYAATSSPAAEDSPSERLAQPGEHRAVDIAIVRLPRISNFTDFAPLERHPALGVRYVRGRAELAHPDLVIIPGTKSTMDDLLWLRQSGLEMAIRKLWDAGTPVLGICGGYQMMGKRLSDPLGIERGGEMTGMGLLPCTTVFCAAKTRSLTQATVAAGPCAGAVVEGYQIHMGQTTRAGGTPFCVVQPGGKQSADNDLGDADGTSLDAARPCEEDGTIDGHAMGTYLHGLFDTGEMVDALANWLLERKGIATQDVHTLSHADYLEQQIDLLAREVRTALNMEAIYEAMEQYER